MRRFFYKHVIFISVSVFFLMLGGYGIPKGLSSLDAHGVINSANRLLDGDSYIPSRPPGHPSYEFYLLYLPVKSINLFADLRIGWFYYNFLQMLGGLLLLASAWRLLSYFSNSIKLVGFCTTFFVCTPGFIKNSMGGDEFLWAILFFNLAVLPLFRCLVQKKKLSMRDLLLSSLCFAISTGFRQELVFTFILYPLYIKFNKEESSGLIFKFILIKLIFGLIIWLPVLIGNNFSLPVPLPTEDSVSDLGIRFLVGSYKIIFLHFTLPVSIALAFGLVALVIQKNKLKQESHESFLLISVLCLGTIYVSLFYYYPYKQDILLFLTPLILASLLALKMNNLIKSIFILSFISLLVNVDIFNKRTLVAPHLKQGIYQQVLTEKPYFKSRKISLMRKCLQEGHKSFVITPCWEWDFEYLQNESSLRSKIVYGPRNLPYKHYYFIDNPNQVFVTRRALEQSDLIKEKSLQGYSIYSDKDLFRTFHYRYVWDIVLGDTDLKNDITYNLL